MRLTIHTWFRNEIRSRTTVRVLRQSNQQAISESVGQQQLLGNQKQHDEAKETRSDTPCSTTEYRENQMHIQMLSKSLFEQVFKKPQNTIDPERIRSYHENLRSFGLKPGSTDTLPDVDLQLPLLRGSNLEEHFYEIGREQSKEYLDLIQFLLKANIPKLPIEWSSQSGWTKYDSNGEAHAVPYPEEHILVFDVEVCMSEGSAPTLACAVSSKHWYSWSSPKLSTSLDSNRDLNNSTGSVKYYTDDEFIPLESDSDTKSRNAAKLVIGHNVSFDRARIRNQYQLKSSGMRFLDTMSLHVCVSGITSYQRAMLKSKKQLNDSDLIWSTQSSLNSLLEVYKLYCGDNVTDQINKETRSIFVTGSLSDIKDNFQVLMTYCAKDVVATFRVFEKLFPLYCERFPHPVTFAGILEMGMAYLPVNTNWLRYINEANLIYEDLDIESKYLLAKRANQACRLLHDSEYSNDLWMWDQDWSLQEMKLKLSKAKKPKLQSEPEQEQKSQLLQTEYSCLMRKFEHLFRKSSDLPAKLPLLPGYPAWYRKLCAKATEDNWQPGPTAIGTGMQVCPKLLSLSWEGYPLHFIRGSGWGFLVPFKEYDDEMTDIKIPLKSLVEKCPVLKMPKSTDGTRNENDYVKLKKDVEMSLGKKDYYSKSKADPTNGRYIGTGIWCDMELDNSCWFFKLPHKDGESHRVGNPLARDFLVKFSENVLAGDNATAERIIKIARMLSYWRNNRERIMNQLVVVCGAKYLPNLKQSVDKKKSGAVGVAAILPQVVTCGTLTRRAMEPTWMTASNAQEERVGSELRAMVQAPKGYRLVGADVDSQELWIASVLGDAGETGIHGATPLGWMTLNGTKSNATDMHSVTAKAVGISRNHAKILNYARIYGAGQSFASRLLKQFNPTISDGEAKSKAAKMFSMTKGKKLFLPKDEYRHILEDRGYSKYETLQIAARYRKPIDEMFQKGKWIGGTESAMFNQLELIAEMDQPKTPFLNSHLSRALEPQAGMEDRFLPTRVNWVVQSGAVDFLHLMVVCMRWLMSNKVRFCLSFHDEVRYMTKEEHAYHTALAMHVTNLLTRSFFASRLGLMDLPQSIAFFGSVEVDTVLRKEAHSDSKSPSNPHGLYHGYDIPPGESLNVFEAIEKANGNDLKKWPWHKNQKL